MSGSIRRQQIQWVLFASAATLILYHVLVLRPLSQTAEHLDQPLADAWRQLERSGEVSAQGESINQLELHTRLRDAEAALSRMRDLTNTLSQRVMLNREVMNNLERPFQLIEFEIERQYRIEELLNLAKEKKVEVSANLTYSFPEFSNETREPPLLWGQLALLYQVLGLAIHCGVSGIQEVKVLPMRVFEDPALTVNELLFDVTLVGPMDKISVFLANLPLREEEIKAKGGPQVFPWKPAMYLDSLMIRKSSAQRPDEVRADVRLSGFVLRRPVPLKPEEGRAKP